MPVAPPNPPVWRRASPVNWQGMSDKDKEIRELREQVRLLTERIFRIERQLGSGTRIESPPAVPVAAPAVPAESAAPPVASPPVASQGTAQLEASHLGAAPGSTMPSAAARQQPGQANYGLVEDPATSHADGGLVGVPAKSESLETRSQFLRPVFVIFNCTLCPFVER